jgi:hypothetical protein
MKQCISVRNNTAENYMSTLGAILLILAGLGTMAFGIFIFYAWLPLFYGLFGLEIGILLGRSLTGDVGLLAVLLGVVGAGLLFAASYTLEPFRRILLGLSAGAAVGLSIASLMGLEDFIGGVLGTVLAVVGAVIGASIVPRYFDAFVIGASAFGGAAMAMAGAHLLFPGVGLFDRAAGGILPALVTVGLAIVGIVWQLKNIVAWARTSPLYGSISGTSVKDGSRS